MSAWPKVLLGSCCDIVSGATPSTSVDAYWGGDIFWVTPKDLSSLESTYISKTSRTLTKQGLQSCGASILPPNSVLFSSRAPIGHVAINTVPMATNQGFKSFIPRKNVRSDFLYWWLRTNRTYLENLGNGATFKEVSKAIVERIEIPIPSLTEQKRIAEILDRAEALRAKRRAALAQLDTLTQSIFLEMFGDTSNIKFNVLNACAVVVSGVAKGRKLCGGEIQRVPYLRVANVQAGFMDLSEIKTIEATPAEISELSLEPGDIVLTEGGDHDKLGRGAMWEGQVAPCIHQNHIFRVRVNSELLEPRFFHEHLQTPSAKKYFLRCAKRTTNLASINMTQLRLLPVPLPPLPLQQEFAKRAAAVEKLKESHRKSLAELDSLFASLQHRAFRGEL